MHERQSHSLPLSFSTQVFRLREEGTGTARQCWLSLNFRVSGLSSGHQKVHRFIQQIRFAMTQSLKY